MSTYQYSLVVLPTLETVNRLKDIFTSSPIFVDWPQLNVVVAESDTKPDSLLLETKKVYSSKFLFFGLIYVEDLGRSVLRGVLDQDELGKLANDFIGCPYQEKPYMSFDSKGTALSRQNKFFISSVSEVLVSKEETPFTFHWESLLTR